MLTLLGVAVIKHGWWQSAAKVPSPNYNARPNLSDISLLVIHNISLPPKQYGGSYIEDFFQNRLQTDVHPYFQEIKDLRVSSHILIKREGFVTQFVSFNDRAWHAGASSFEGRENCNDFSIGIELEGCDDEAFSDEQYRSLTALSVDIMQAYPKITVDRITGHSDIAPGRKTDPGIAFDWPRYKNSLL